MGLWPLDLSGNGGLLWSLPGSALPKFSSSSLVHQEEAWEEEIPWVLRLF